MKATENVQPLDRWIIDKIGGSGNRAKRIDRNELLKYQLCKINETMQHVMENSSFYKEKYKGFTNCAFGSLEEISDLPFTTTDELIAHGKNMICVSAGDISRIVTLKTSGTTGNPKRIYFTADDQELTVDYFHHGMKNLVEKNDTVLILLPCSTPGNVGDLLAKGLGRLGCDAVPYGFPDISKMNVLDDLSTIIKEKGITSMVGSPEEVLNIAEFTADKIGSNQIKTVLLSTDYISDNLRSRIGGLWGALVFEHYGSTEMGLGGAVSCHVLTGYHPRENDLYFEIVNQKTGKPVAEGEYGEIVFTTLTRKGMPLIRYKTGDISRWIPGTCPCGSFLKRMDKVLPRGIRKGGSLL